MNPFSRRYRQTDGRIHLPSEIGSSRVYEAFCRIEKKSSLDPGLICKTFKAIRAETWENINRLTVISCIHNKRAEKSLQSLRKLLPNILKVVDVSRRRISGEDVPSDDKILSLNEPHTELISRGRREKPAEFGHKLLLTQTKGKIIIDYHVFKKSLSDTQLSAAVRIDMNRIWAAR